MKNSTDDRTLVPRHIDALGMDLENYNKSMFASPDWILSFESWIILNFSIFNLQSPITFVYPQTLFATRVDSAEREDVESISSSLVYKPH